MKRISKIEPTEVRMPALMKVAAYARVSMVCERLQHSLSAQVSYYSTLIQKHAGWQYVGVYADDGISGTGTAQRGEFNRMLHDCETGKIDIVLTKSISRFARNTVDLLNTVRHLKEIGISVRFEKENIDSLSEDGELMLTLLASFAQEESRSISENVKWGTVKRFQQGIPNGQMQIYGYEWIEGRMTIIPEEAKIIRYMYQEYLRGASRIEIGRTLNEKGIHTYHNKMWADSNVKSILTNITYTGNLLFQKEYTVDPITKHHKKNRGELPQFFAEDTHDAIIPMDEFQAVQTEFKRRRDLGPFGNKSLHLTAFSTKIVCGKCGKHYRRRTNKNIAGDKCYRWMCQTKDREGSVVCDSRDIPEEALQNAAANVMGLTVFDDALFTSQVKEILVVNDNTLCFHFYDGREVTTQWEWKSTARVDCWTPERRQFWSKCHCGRDNNPNRSLFLDFTGFIRCGLCGANFRCQAKNMKDGTRRRTWHCPTLKSNCKDSVPIDNETMKTLVTEVLGLASFDVAVMDSQLEFASIIKGSVSFHFRDGHEVSRKF